MGWLETYLKFTEEQESPEAFHLWAAIAVLGHVMGKRVWVDRFHYRVWPAQIMVVLVSGSAVTRKSTAVEMAARFLDYLPETLVNPIADITSTERMLQDMERTDEDGNPIDAVGLILNDELGTFLSRATYAETLCSHINKLNTTSKPIVRVKFRSWEVTLHNPCVGMLAATTPTGFAEEMPKAAMTGGFMGRILPVYQEHPKQPNSLIDPPSRYKVEERWLMAQLNRISKMKGEMVQTPEAKRWYKEWYEKHVRWVMANVMEEHRDSGYYGRKHDHLTRVAMVLSGAMDSSMAIGVQHYKGALGLIEQLEAFFPQVIKDVGARQQYSAVAKPMLVALERNGALGWSDLLRRLHRYGNRDTLRPELLTLIDAGLIRRRLNEKGIEVFERVWTRGEMLQRVPHNHHTPGEEDREHDQDDQEDEDHLGRGDDPLDS